MATHPGNLQTHKMSKHENTKEYICNACGYQTEAKFSEYWKHEGVRFYASCVTINTHKRKC
jgi:hypothetical protein